MFAMGLVRRAAAASAAASSLVSRSFSRAFSAKSSGAGEQGLIPGVEGLAGRARAEAMVKKVYGEELFDRDANSFFEEGTRENPIPILSTEDERIVGISLPDDAEVRWMVLRKNELVYDPDTCNFFALKQVTKEEVDAWVAQAEKQNAGL